MRGVPLLLGGLLAATIGLGQTDPVLLARIRSQMAANLTRLPDYTCLETIERSVRRAPSRKFQMQDMLRLEVGISGGRELYAWPGSGKFDDRQLIDMVRGGAIGDGNFGAFARALFVGDSGNVRYAGEETVHGRRAHRYDYDVPLFRSGYRLRVAPNEELVAYHGSFWADAATLDVLRMEVAVAPIPPELGLDAAGHWIEYGRTRIGQAEFLLPVRSEMTLLHTRGDESRNRTTFSACRQFTRESVLTFADIPESAPAAPVVEERTLPAGLTVDVRLETALDSATAARGDQVFATVERDVKEKRRVLIPKGARVHGRLLRMERIPTPAIEIYTIGLEFSILEFDNVRARTRAVVVQVGGAPGGSVLVPGKPEEWPARWGYSIIRRTEPGDLYVKGSRVNLPRGLRLSLRTGPLPSEEKP